jgi:hypothetical protein
MMELLGGNASSGNHTAAPLFSRDFILMTTPDPDVPAGTRRSFLKQAAVAALAAAIPGEAASTDQPALKTNLKAMTCDVNGPILPPRQATGRCKA